MLSLDDSKVFGPHLQQGELEAFMKVAPIFTFLLDHVRDGDQSLKDLIEGTFVYVIFKDVLKKVIECCNGCINKTPMDASHLCKTLNIHEDFLETVVRNVVKESEIQNNFQKKVDDFSYWLMLGLKTKEMLLRHAQSFSEKTRELALQINAYKEFNVGKIIPVAEFWQTVEDLPRDLII